MSVIATELDVDRRLPVTLVLRGRRICQETRDVWCPWNVTVWMFLASVGIPTRRIAAIHVMGAAP